MPYNYYAVLVGREGTQIYDNSAKVSGPLCSSSFTISIHRLGMHVSTTSSSER
ncbi:hypothetical protein M404DRAFT_671739 [Pisolithus tinctorius Marx 270]|uniref:Uncharacterized protein n=1 Tax=Pisolithus tinctorius Marx 270 TaxID=870435 RepID=A0A0C3JYL0_PISTI|nr:hypothetical protein M404DRAFT_671739 [Pisolithus tinctorius Marx 270]